MPADNECITVGDGSCVALDPCVHSISDEDANMTYIGTDWRTALSRNVTVALEFAEHELDGAEGIGDAALLIREALDECNRLLRDAPR